MPNYTLLSEINATTGIDSVLVSMANDIPFLFPSILIAVFFAMLLIGMFYNEKRTGNSNFFKWASVSSTITTFGALVLFLIDGLIPLSTIVLVISFNIIFSVIFMFMDNTN